MKKFFIVSDIHGYYTILLKTLQEHGFDAFNQDHVLVCCGDLFDGGQEAQQLYNFVINLGERFVFIRGNHEDLFADCFLSIYNETKINSLHYFNKTMDTFYQLTNLIPRIERKKTIKILEPVYNFIENNTYLWFEIDKFILVHGWVPSIKLNKKNIKFTYDPLWNNIPNDSHNDEKKAFYNSWEEARWDNGIDMCKFGSFIPEKTIVCGHDGCSSWRAKPMATKRIPTLKTEIDWESKFMPYISENIIAIDSCVIYSKIINCLVIESENFHFGAKYEKL